MHLGGGTAGPDGGEWATGQHEVPRTIREPDDRVEAGRDPHELAVRDELQVAARGRRYCRSALVEQRDELCDAPAVLVVLVLWSVPDGSRVLGVDGSLEVVGDLGDDLRQLDRFGDVVDEVDEDAEVDQEERLGHGDREVGDELPGRRGGDASECHDGVHEGADEDAQRHLIAEIAHEMTHHARTELLGREGQGQDGDREDDPNHGDDRGGNGDEHLAAGVGASRPEPERERELVVVGGDVNRERGCEEHQRDDHEDAGHQPEGGAERLFTPTGELATATRRGGHLDWDHWGELRIGQAASTRSTRSRPVFPAHLTIPLSLSAPGGPARPCGSDRLRTIGGGLLGGHGRAHLVCDGHRHGEVDEWDRRPGCRVEQEVAEHPATPPDRKVDRPGG